MTQERPLGPADGHLDLDTLADLDEGLAEPAVAAAHEAHLTQCRACREQLARLRSTRVLLGSLPPEPMPAAVAERIDALLGGAAAASTVMPLTPARRPWRSHPTAAGLGVAAAAAALIAAIVVGTTRNSDNSGKPGTQAGASPPTARLLTLPITVSGRHYTTANLSRLAPQLVAGAATATPTPAAGAAGPSTVAGAQAAAVPPTLARLHDSPSALAGCVAALEKDGPTQIPLAVDFAYFAGRPAVVVVLPGLRSGFIDTWIVGANCSASDADLLNYTSLPAPSPG